MLSSEEIAILEKALKYHQGRFNYYLVLAIILIILSVGLYLALRRNGALFAALAVCLGIWYYPWRYYSKSKLIQADIETNTYITILTSIYGKSRSKMNRLQPYYYIYTDNHEEFEVSKGIFKHLNEGDHIRLRYTIQSKTVLKIERVNGKS